MYVCVRALTHRHTYTYTHIYIYNIIYLLYACMHAYASLSVYICIHTNTQGALKATLRGGALAFAEYWKEVLAARPVLQRCVSCSETSYTTWVLSN